MRLLTLAVLLLVPAARAAETSVASGVETAMSGVYSSLTPARQSALSAFTASAAPDPAALLTDLQRADSGGAAVSARSDALVRLASARRLSPEQAVELAARLDMVEETLSRAGLLAPQAEAALQQARLLAAAKLRDPALQARLATLMSRTAAALQAAAPPGDAVAAESPAAKRARMPDSWKLQRARHGWQRALESTHPAFVVLARNIARLKRKPTDERLDPERTLAFIQEVNDGLPGAFEFAYGGGSAALVYVEHGRRYFVSVEDGTVGFSDEPIFLFYDRGTQRFERPKSMASLVGIEQDYDGELRPIFSTSRHLSEFRDMSAYGGASLGFFGGSVKDHEALPRVAMEVPLVAVRTTGVLKQDAQALEALPDGLRDLLASGHTLTTVPSLGAIARGEHGVDQAGPADGYSALIIGDEHGQGRTGIVLHRGLPIIVRRDGKEYFLEIKGVGLATQAPLKERLHQRQAGTIRSGRASVSQVEREFEGADLVRASGMESRDLAIPILGVALPEYADKDEPYRGPQQWVEQSGEVFRLAPSTRRLAYSDNPAYGPPYSRRPLLLRRAIEYYGELFARLRLLPPGQAAMHKSPHPQNFVYFPNEKTFAITDFSDIHRVEAHSYLRPEMPDIDQYLAFKTPENRAALLRGLRKGLEPRGLWTPSLEALGEKPFNQKKLSDTLVSEILLPQFLAAEDAQTIRKELVPVTVPPYHMTAIVDGERHALGEQPSYIEISYRLYIRELERREERLKLLAAARVFTGEASALREQAKAALGPLRALRAKALELYEDEQKKGKAAWRGDLKDYARALMALIEKEAALYDSLRAYPVSGAGSNVNVVRASAVARYAAAAD